MNSKQCGLVMLEGEGGLGSAVADGLADNGYAVRYAWPDGCWDVGGCAFILIYGPMHSLGRALLRLRELPHVPPVVVWFTEQMPWPALPPPLTAALARCRYELERSIHTGLAQQVAASSHLASLLQRAGRLRAVGEMLALQRRGWLKRICVFTQTNCDLFQRLGLPAAIVPMGYHQQFGERLGLERDIDVLFLGSTNDRRRGPLIADLERRLAARGISFVVRDGRPGREAVFGAERTALLNRAKIMLSIMRQPWDDPVFRTLLAAPNGAMVLSEGIRPTSVGPFRIGEHLVAADLPDMVDAITFYAAHEGERSRIAEQAYARVTGELTMSAMVAALLHSLQSHQPILPMAYAL